MRLNRGAYSNMAQFSPKVKIAIKNGLKVRDFVMNFDYHHHLSLLGSLRSCLCNCGVQSTFTLKGNLLGNSIQAL